jgi:hypothetical protein
MLGSAASPMGKEANSRQWWVPTEVLCCPEANDMLGRLCSMKEKYL